MIPYSEPEQKQLVEQLCRDIFVAAGRRKPTPGAPHQKTASTLTSSANSVSIHSSDGQRKETAEPVTDLSSMEQNSLLQILFELEFEQKFIALVQSIYRRLPAL